MKVEKASRKQKNHLRQNLDTIANFDYATKSKFLGYLKINCSQLSKTECDELINDTNEIVLYGKRNIDMKVSVLERDIIEGLRLIKLTDFTQISKCVCSLIKEQEVNYK